jgi:hypothetical protein
VLVLARNLIFDIIFCRQNTSRSLADFLSGERKREHGKRKKRRKREIGKKKAKKKKEKKGMRKKKEKRKE